MDYKLEVVVVPVSDVDRAKAFYQGLGWRLDADFVTGPDFRVVQVTPPGSACAVIFGTGLTISAPGSADGLQLVAEDIEAARADLAARGAPVTEVFHDANGVFHRAGRPIASQARPRTTTVTARGSRSLTRTATPGTSRRSPPGCRAERPPRWLPSTRWPPGRGAAPRGGGTRQARGGDRAGRPGLAGLVRAVHGGRFGPGGRGHDCTAGASHGRTVMTIAPRDPLSPGASRNCSARPSSSSAAARASGWRQPARARSEGAEVILAARRPDRLRQAAAEVGAGGTAAFDATTRLLSSVFSRVPRSTT